MLCVSHSAFATSAFALKSPGRTGPLASLESRSAANNRSRRTLASRQSRTRTSAACSRAKRPRSRVRRRAARGRARRRRTSWSSGRARVSTASLKATRTEDPLFNGAWGTPGALPCARFRGVVAAWFEPTIHCFQWAGIGLLADPARLVPETRFSTPRSQGKRASRAAMVWAVVSSSTVATGAGGGGGVRRNRRLRAWARPPPLPVGVAALRTY